MARSEVPVLIVGGGAAGNMLSLDLARRGVRIRTIDRSPGPGDTSRALVVHARTAEILERIDKNLIARYVERAIHNSSFLFGLTRHTGYTLLALPGTHGGSKGTGEPIESLQDLFGNLLRCHRLQSSADVTRCCGSDPEDRFFLIRPDGYVGYRCRTLQVARLVSHLGEYLLWSKTPLSPA